ncbi:MAG: flagellar biosynthesis protein FlhB [Roseivivax sp.]|nr:flagellar biosynthesis protein FlhB [Roseivivax sp.]
MAAEDNDSEKSHEPSQKKLRDARKRGEIVRSADVAVAAGYAGLWLGLTLFGAGWLLVLGDGLAGFLRHADWMAGAFMRDPALLSIGSTIKAFGLPVLGLLGTPMLAVLLFIVAQRGFVFAPSRLMPKAQRLNPIRNAGNKFGRSGLFEFIKSFAKLSIYSICLVLFLRNQMDVMLSSVLMAPAQSILLIGELGLQLLLVIAVVAVAVGAVDYLFQHTEFMRKNRMSHKEIRDEMKEAEGDPTMKAARRSKAQMIALNGMLADVPKASVVVVNPTHYAVALSWDRGAQSAPKCVAKGVDEIAARIREVAQEAGVPIHHDPPTARSLHATVEIGEEIDPSLYAPVAAAIRFADAMRDKVRRGGIS